MDIAEELLYMSAEERKLWRQTHGYNVYTKQGDYNLLRKTNSRKK